MTRISRRHPRYRSLRIRHQLGKELQSGLVVPEGLMAHGRGEAFDYLLGERSSASALRAERVAAQWLLSARHPVLSVNGNVAALAATEVARLSRVIPKLRVEVNLFHRSPARVRAVARRLQAAGVRHIYGIHPDGRVPGLPSDRALVDREGILRADVCLIPLEDGDRTAALKQLGKRVISIDLNPMSRTSLDADLPIIDELVRALRAIARWGGQKERGKARRAAPSPAALRADAFRTIQANLSRWARSGNRPQPVPSRPGVRRLVAKSVRRFRRTR